MSIAKLNAEMTSREYRPGEEVELVVEVRDLSTLVMSERRELSDQHGARRVHEDTWLFHEPEVAVEDRYDWQRRGGGLHLDGRTAVLSFTYGRLAVLGEGVIAPKVVATCPDSGSGRWAVHPTALVAALAPAQAHPHSLPAEWHNRRLRVLEPRTPGATLAADAVEDEVRAAQNADQCPACAEYGGTCSWHVDNHYAGSEEIGNE